MGFFDALKKSRRQVNRENQEQGRAGERKIKEEYEFSGYKVTRTGKGHDLKAEKKDWFGNKTTKYIEVKTGNSKLSKLQKRKRGRLGEKYVVERLEPTPFGLQSNNRESDLSSKRKKESNSNSLGFGKISFWGSSSDTKKKTTKKKKSSGVSIWGNNKPTKKKKSSGVSIWGNSKPTKKKKSSGVSIWGDSKPTKKKKSSGVSIWGDSSSGKKRKRKSDSIW